MGSLFVQHLIQSLADMLLCSSHRGVARLDMQGARQSKVTRWINQEIDPTFPFGMVPVKVLLSYMYISMHRNYAVVKFMTKILKHFFPLSYKNYHAKRTGVKIGASKGRICPC